MNQATLDPATQFLQRARQTIERLDWKQRLQAAALFEADPSISKQRLFDSFDDEQWRWISTVGVEENEALARCLPPLPAKEVQLRFTGDSGRSTLQRAFAVYARLRSLCGRYQVELSRVLEFGCGWGRILRFFVRDLEPENIFGIDVHPEMVALCNSGAPWARVTRCQSQPPTALPDRHFDLIYAYSVFTHLSETAHLAWLTEFDRLLRPGGLLVLTTRPRGFIEMCARYSASNDNSPWMAGLKKAFPDPARTLAEYDQGRFIFAPVGGGDFLSSEFYGEACVPLSYVQRVWVRTFALCETDEAEDYQLFIVLRKPAPAGSQSGQPADATPKTA
jgi:SAM-dependent methyltransferase